MGIFNFLKKPKIGVGVSIHEATPDELCRQKYDEIQQIKELQRNSFPSKNGLRPHEILMLYYAPSYSVNETSFPQFWYYEYAIDNPRKVLDSLNNRGFIRKASAKESIGALTVDNLKYMLKSSGIKPIGKKEALIQLVQANIDEQVLESEIQNRKYALTQLGASELNENEYVPYMHKYKYKNISVWDINKDMQSYPPHLWRDCIWGRLNRIYCDLIKAVPQNINRSMLSGLLYQQAEFLMEENKIAAAFDLVVDGIYIDANYNAVFQFENEIELHINKIKTDDILSYAEIVFNHYGCGLILIKKVYGDVSKSGINEMLEKAWISRKLQDIWISKSEFFQLILSNIFGDNLTFVDVCNNIQERILKNYKYAKTKRNGIP